MVFPAETDQQIRQTALSICQDHFRKVLDVARKVTQMVDCFVKDDKTSAKVLYNEITNLESEVDALRRNITLDLAKIGDVLRSREDFLRFINQTNEIADFCGGIGFRLIEIMERGWKKSSKIKDSLMKLSEGAFDTVTKLRDTIITLSYNSNKAIEKAKEVEDAEKTVDEIYRKVELELLNSDIDIPTLLLLRDVTQLFEDITDKAQDASDAACVLAFVM